MRDNFVWAFTWRQRSPGGNAVCSECKKEFKFHIDDYLYVWRFYGKRFTKCTHCGNIENNSIIVFDPNGNYEKANKLIEEYVKKYPPQIGK